MKRRNQVIVSVLFPLFLFAQSGSSVRTSAQENSATLAETTAWIKNALVSEGLFVESTSTTRVQVKLYDIRFNSCSMYYKEDWTQDNDYQGKKTQNLINHVYEFSMSDLDPASVEITSVDWYLGTKTWRVNLQTSGKKPKIKLMKASTLDLKHIWPEYRTYGESHIAFQIQHKDMPDRISRAFKHAIKLCGGKVDPF